MKSPVQAAIAAALALLSTPAFATEYPWSAIARQCGVAAAEALHAKTGCASCTDSWTSGAWCAVNTYYRGQIPEPILKSAITNVWKDRARAHTCGACGNPIDEVFFKVGGIR